MKLKETTRAYRRQTVKSKLRGTLRREAKKKTMLGTMTIRKRKKNVKERQEKEGKAKFGRKGKYEMRV